MRLLRALRGEALDRPPVWFMRQAGRYLPEYRELRRSYSFEEAMSTPELAAEITLQPMRRFPLDAAIVFADIMTPFGAVGLDVRFEPGPKLDPLDLDDIVRLPSFDPARAEFVAETISRVKEEVGPEVAVIGFAGAPTTLLAYLLEGSGSRNWPLLRRALYAREVDAALARLSEITRRYLSLQIDAGADAVQLFDSWAGIVSVEHFLAHTAPAARASLEGLAVPTIYFAPASAHLLSSFPQVEATAYGVDWRMDIDRAWNLVGEAPLQGNLDPAVLLSDVPTVVAETTRLLEIVGGRPGHVFNLGHGIFPNSPVDNVAAMVDTVVDWPEATSRKGIA